MPAPALHIVGLHLLLWGWADPETRTLRIQQKALAEDLCVTPYVLNRAFAQLEREGRISVVPPGTGRAKLYLITDPAQV